MNGRALCGVCVAAVCLSALLLAGCRDEASKPKKPDGQEQDKGAMERAGEKAGELSRTAKEKTVGAAEVVKEKSVETYEKAKEGAKDFAEGYKKGLEGETEKVPDEVQPAESPPVPEP